MRIGFFTDTYTPQINGVVTSIELFRHELERLGHTVLVCAPTPRQSSDTDRIVRVPSMKFVFQPEMRVAAPYSVEAMRAIKAMDLDIIHSHDPFAIGLLGLAVAKRYRIPYVHTYHTLYPEYVHYIWETRFTKELAARLSRDFCARCDAVVAPSTKIERALRGWGYHGMLKVVPTGVDTSEFERAPAEDVARIRAEFGVGPDERMLLFVGRLGKEKSIDLLVRTLPHLREGARLVIAGNGPYRPELEALIAQLRVADRVGFVGYLDRRRIALAYQAADIFVFASTSETQGLVISEAMAAGVPIVAVDDLAVADMVKDGENGLLVPGNEIAMATAIDHVLGDEERRLQMGVASERLAEELSIEHQTLRLLSVYDQVLRRKRAEARLRLRARARLRRVGARLIRPSALAVRMRKLGRRFE